MLLILFWMVATLQVYMSIFIHARSILRRNAATLSIKTSQLKDDLLACLIMGTALISQHSEATGVIYLLATFVIVWLGRRTRERFELIGRQ